MAHGLADVVQEGRPPRGIDRCAELGRDFGYGHVAVLNYLSGRSVPPVTKAEFFAKALDYPAVVMRQILANDRSIFPDQLKAEASAFFAARDQRQLAEREKQAQTDLYPIIKAANP